MPFPHPRSNRPFRIRRDKYRFADPGYIFIYYMDTYLTNASAGHAPEALAQRDHARDPAHGGGDPPEVCRAAQPQPDQGPPPAEADAPSASAGHSPLQALRLLPRRRES